MGKPGIVPPFLASALDGGECSASRPSHFTPHRKSIRYRLDRGLGGPQWTQRPSGRRGEEKNMHFPGNLISSNRAHNLVTILSELPLPFFIEVPRKNINFIYMYLYFRPAICKTAVCCIFFFENFAFISLVFNTPAEQVNLSVTFQICIRKMFCSNPGRDTGYLSENFLWLSHSYSIKKKIIYRFNMKWRPIGL
jgi:hypothetical protein